MKISMFLLLNLIINSWFNFSIVYLTRLKLIIFRIYFCIAIIDSILYISNQYEFQSQRNQSRLLLDRTRGLRFEWKT